MVKKIIFLFLMAFVTVFSYAEDKVTLTANAPDAVVSGDQFRLTFTVNTQNGKDFIAPTVKGFDVLMGPSRSTQSSTQIMNGNVTTTSSTTYTYILMATAEGTYTIPAASIEVNGEKVFSNALTIKVLPPDKDADTQSGQQSSGTQSRQRRQQQAGTKISDGDLFFTTTASKTDVYEQEAILLTYKVYTTLDLRQLGGNISDFTGFHSQEIDLPQQKEWSLENYKGRNYRTILWRQFIIFPQQTGKLEIPSVEFEGIIAQRVQTDDPFDAFFNGGGIVEVKKKIYTPKLTINVKPLPSKPEGYSGGVGEFSISSEINKNEVKTNDAITIKITLNGTGNMKLVSDPELKFPEDFEVYDPKVTNDFKVTKAGVSGKKVIEYLAVPRHAGDFTVPAAEFKYFDIKSGAYKTLTTEEYKIHVEKGQGDAGQVIADFTSKESVKLIGEDIRFIKRGDTSYSKKGDFFFGTVSYCLWYIIPLILFIAATAFWIMRNKENANVAKVRTKKANKVATKRMKLAGKLLAENKKNEFYDEVLKTLWGYISDKLNIPVSQLSKDNIEAELTKHGSSEELTKEFIDTLNECEFARYAPGDESKAMDNVYQASVNVISKMENSIKKK